MKTLKQRLAAQLKDLDARISRKTSLESADTLETGANAPIVTRISERKALSPAARIRHYPEMERACPCIECRDDRNEYPTGGMRLTARSPRWGRSKPGQCW
jgi:hypothetical protein